MTRDPVKTRFSALIQRSWRLLARQITPHASRQNEILKHAIQYLSEEFVFEDVSAAECGGCLDAIQLLMSRIPSIDVRDSEAASMRKQINDIRRQSLSRNLAGRHVVPRASRL